MKIQDMFLKQIDRPITGVIKVGQIQDEDKRQELEEYVITNELRKHLREFFDNYARSIQNPTDEMGVWISGFFGSGKSHFLKILSYILDNTEVAGKKAMEYFQEKDDLQGEGMLLANMELSGNTPTQAILFNVDSKSAAAAKADSNAIVSVFNRVFNEKLGYDGANPALADLERELDNEGRYQEFQSAFLKVTGKVWVEERHKFRLIRSHVEKALVEMGYMTMENAQIWTRESTTQPYQLAIGDFAKRVQEYIEKSGNRVVFLVDEIGQFIASDSHLMLNLQTMVEELGTHCQGKAWVIVTAQEDIDSMTENMQDRQNDFSKIQGRFKTRLSLSSVNADEVIRKRILKKNQTGTDTLTALYDTKETTIRNVVQFKTSIEMKKIENAQDFVEDYPFLPYQFHLLADVLNAIRLNSSTGKHLSEGERSMLGAYQQAAKHVMRQEEGTLVPFYRFYDDLVKFLDHTHATVILRAEENSHLNPLRDPDCFTVNVLKTLFLLKYVKGIDLTVGNIVSLMVTNIEEDRIALRSKVEDALNLLVGELLVSKIQDTYEFLTDEEQDINRAIAQRNITQPDVIRAITRLTFDDIYTNTRYRVSKFNGRYTFAYNQTVDNQPAKNNQNNEIGLRLITPKYISDSGHSITDESSIATMFAGSHEAIFVLPETNVTYYNEMANALRIEDYIRNVTDPGKGKSTTIRAAKMQEAERSKEVAKKALIEAIGEAAIYINGNKVTDITTHDASTRINEALGRLVESVFYKLSYMDAPKDDQDIRDLFKPYQQQKAKLSGPNTTEENANALREMKDQIGLRTSGYAQISLKAMIDQFVRQPFGYIDSDIRWLVAKLFKDGQISIAVNKEPVTLFNHTPEDLAVFFINRKYMEQMLIRAKEIISPKQIAACKSVINELFQKTEVTSDPDKIMADFQERAGDMIEECQDILKELRMSAHFPGRSAAEKTVRILTEMTAIRDVGNFFKKVTEREGELKDLAEDITPVCSFYKSENLKGIFRNNGLQPLRLYDSSKEHINDPELERIVGAIRRIVNHSAPYEMIKNLPNLSSEFAERYSAILDEKLKPVIELIEQDKQNVLSFIEGKFYEEQYKAEVIKAFFDLEERASRENNISNMLGFKDKADSLCKMYIAKFSNIPDPEPEGGDEKGGGKDGKKDGNGETGGKSGQTGTGGTKPAKQVTVMMARDITTQWVITNETQLAARMEAFYKRIKAELDKGNNVTIQF